jgi:hypothetical protein
MNLVAMKAHHIPTQLVEKYLLVPDAHDDTVQWLKVVVMDHVKEDYLNDFIADLEQEIALNC